MSKVLIGVDEAGRGPLAGPVAVGAVAVPRGFDIKAIFPGLTDSKLLRENKREELFAILEELHKKRVVRYNVSFGVVSTIEKIGIVNTVKRSVFRSINNLEVPTRAAYVLLDGLLQAPPQYKQQTIIRGDVSEPVISLASIAAKVCRDRLMRRLSKRYPQYKFESNKGYGTAAHIQAIKQGGLCAVHRKSFCRNIAVTCTFFS